MPLVGLRRRRAGRARHGRRQAVVLAIGEDWRTGLFTGFLLALSSTAIVLKLLSDTGRTGTVRGRLALSTLIFQDLAVVAMVLVVPLLGADSDGGAAALAEALGIAVAVVGVVLVVARRVMPPVLPLSAGCADCRREGLDWVHLRICLGCGHVGCCDSSPGRHARAHHERSDHPLMASLEPGETWGYCFLDDTTVEGPRPA